MTNLVLHRDRPNGLVEIARSHVSDGSISELATPALLRRVAREQLGAEIELRVVVVVAFPVFVPPKDDFALVEYEVRPGVRNYRLARVPRNDGWSIRLGAFERAVRRTLRGIGRRLAGSFAGPAQIVPAPEAAYRLQAVSPARAALSAGPSRF